MATCPECDAEIEIDDDDLEDMEIGDPWDCDGCGSRLRVASLDPVDFESDEDDEDEEDEEEGNEDGKAADDDADLDDDLDDDETDDGGDWEE